MRSLQAMGLKMANENGAKTLISISIPVYDEEGNIQRLYSRLCQLADSISEQYELEFVFTDNRSTDNTWQLIKSIAETDNRVRAFRFSRNFGFQKSILTNYLNTRGAAVMQLDADLQDPPELLVQFLEKWEQGYKVVYGVRKVRPEPWLMRQFRRLGYWVIDSLAGYHVPKNVGDFRLIDRDVIKAIAKLNDQAPYLRGTIASLGFSQIGIDYDRKARQEGKSKFSLQSLLGLGLDGVLTTSTVPLRLATYIGTGIIVMTFLGTLYYVVLKIMNPSLPIGVASTSVLILFSLGLNSLFLGLIGEYVIRMHNNIRGGDIAVIDDAIDPVGVRERGDA
jgi:glycosyltransferase involved in cell wall biosynthesis